MIKVKTEKECVECLGKGFHYEAFSEEKEICWACKGTGKIRKHDKS